MNKKEFLLEAIIKAYICHNEPIGSNQLKKMYNIEFSPATIRGYFKKLVEEGYLIQEHISSGRTPSFEALKLYWTNKLSNLKLKNINLENIKKVSNDFGVTTIIGYNLNNILRNILLMENRYIILEFDNFSTLLNYSNALYKFLEQLKGLEFEYIKDISKQVGAYEVYEKLSFEDYKNSKIYNILPLSKLFENLDEEIIKYYLDGEILKLKEGLYFDSFVPKGYLIASKECKINNKDAKILTIGKLNKDYIAYYNKLEVVNV